MIKSIALAITVTACTVWFGLGAKPGVTLVDGRTVGPMLMPVEDSIGDSLAWYGRFQPMGYGATALTQCSRDSLRVIPITALSGSGGLENTFEGGVLNQAEWQDTTILKVIMFQTGGQQSGVSIIDQGMRCVYVAGQTAPEIPYLTRVETRDSLITDLVWRNTSHEPVGDSISGLISPRDCRRCIWSNVSFHFTNNDAFSINAQQSLSTGDTIGEITLQYSILGPLVNNARLGGHLVDDTLAINMGRCGWTTWTRVLWIEGIRRAPNLGCELPSEIINSMSYNNTDAARVKFRTSVQFIKTISKYGPGTNCAKDRHITYFEEAANPDTSVVHLDSVWAIPHPSCNWTQDTITQLWGAGNDTTVFHMSVTQATVDSAVFRRATEFTAPPIPVIRIDNAPAIEDTLLAYSGNVEGLACDGTWFSRVDVVDSVSRAHVENWTGIDPDNPLYNGRSDWETTYSVTISKPTGTWCTDTDGDHLPDAYENRVRGDNTSLKPDSVINEDIFVFEAYLSGLHPDSVTSGGPAPSTATWSDSIFVRLLDILVDTFFSGGGDPPADTFIVWNVSGAPVPSGINGRWCLNTSTSRAAHITRFDNSGGNAVADSISATDTLATWNLPGCLEADLKTRTLPPPS